jgi:hypothetical protein
MSRQLAYLAKWSKLRQSIYAEALKKRELSSSFLVQHDGIEDLAREIDFLRA